MSGLFQRIARRDEERPDDPVPGDPLDAPTQQFEAAAAQDDAPTTVQPAVAEAPRPAPGPGPPAAPSEPAPAAAPATPEAGTPTAESPPGETAAQETAAAPQRPGFRERGRMRRRLRYLRKLRELQLRDLGGLLFDLRRFERQRDDLLAQKLEQVRACDDELRALEGALDERRDVRDVREPGIGGTCPRCFSVYGSTDRFCAHCGAALGGAAQGPAPVAMPAPEPQAPSPATPASPPPAEAGGPAQ